MLRPSFCVLLSGITLAAAAGAVRGAESPSAAQAGRLQSYLAAHDPHYDPEARMLGQKFHGPGYHSTVEPGTWVHTTVGSLDYAHGLLQRNATGDAQRAAAILERVIGLQDTNTEHKTYGIWPWLLEEPLEKMSPPDWNWADFCGARLAQMLHDHAGLLGDPLKEAIRGSLRHATAAIRKRNVGPDYTNIAVMGGVVCAAAGELLKDDATLEYGRRRLQRVVAYTRAQGGFNEYNSPTYTMVALWESERALRLVRDPQTREAAEALRRQAWEVIAGSFHPATSQWAGPHSRAYSDYLLPQTAEYIADQTGVRVALHPQAGDPRGPRLPPVNALPCPADLQARFKALPHNPLELRRTFARGKSDDSATIGTTWFSEPACLGSVNRASFWTQRRPILGYWATREDPAVVFRARFLHDDRDFASMGIIVQQRGSRLMAVVHSLVNQGDWHPGLDRPRDGIFAAGDLRLRLELNGRGALVEDLGQRRWGLRAGGQRIVVHTPPGVFNGQAIVWTTRQEDDHASVDAVCYRGPVEKFDFSQAVDMVLAMGMELIAADTKPTTTPLRIDREPTLTITWPVHDDFVYRTAP